MPNSFIFHMKHKDLILDHRANETLCCLQLQISLQANELNMVMLWLEPFIIIIFFSLLSVYLVFKVRMKVSNLFGIYNLTYLTVKYNFVYRFCHFCALQIDWMKASHIRFVLFISCFSEKNKPINYSLTCHVRFSFFNEMQSYLIHVKGIFSQKLKLVIIYSPPVIRHYTDLYLCCCESLRILRIHSRGERGLLSLLH